MADDEPTAPSRTGRPLAGHQPLDAIVSAAVPATTYEQLCRLAHARNVSVSALVRTLLQRELKKP